MSRKKNCIGSLLGFSVLKMCKSNKSFFVPLGQLFLWHISPETKINFALLGHSHILYVPFHHRKYKRLK